LVTTTTSPRLSDDHQLAQLRAICPRAADVLAIDGLSASGLQCLKLADEVLIGGRNPRNDLASPADAKAIRQVMAIRKRSNVRLSELLSALVGGEGCDRVVVDTEVAAPAGSAPGRNPFYKFAPNNIPSNVASSRVACLAARSCQYRSPVYPLTPEDSGIPAPEQCK
jgi:hypothetical protein